MLVKALRPFDKRSVGDVFDVDTRLAQELIRNGLVVTHKMQSAPSNKAAPTPQNKGGDAGKALAAGADQPSSVSQAAQASPSTMPTPSADGAQRPVLKLRKPRAKRSP